MLQTTGTFPKLLGWKEQVGIGANDTDQSERQFIKNRELL